MQFVLNRVILLFVLRVFFFPLGAFYILRHMNVASIGLSIKPFEKKQ